MASGKNLEERIGTLKKSPELDPSLLGDFWSPYHPFYPSSVHLQVEVEGTALQVFLTDELKEEGGRFWRTVRFDFLVGGAEGGRESPREAPLSLVYKRHSGLELAFFEILHDPSRPDEVERIAEALERRFLQEVLERLRRGPFPDPRYREAAEAVYRLGVYTAVAEAERRQISESAHPTLWGPPVQTDELLPLPPKGDFFEFMRFAKKAYAALWRYAPEKRPIFVPEEFQVLLNREGPWIAKGLMFLRSLPGGPGANWTVRFATVPLHQEEDPPVHIALEAFSGPGLKQESRLTARMEVIFKLPKKGNEENPSRGVPVFSFGGEFSASNPGFFFWFQDADGKFLVPKEVRKKVACLPLSESAWPLGAAVRGLEVFHRVPALEERIEEAWGRMVEELAQKASPFLEVLEERGLLEALKARQELEVFLNPRAADLLKNLSGTPRGEALRGLHVLGLTGEILASLDPSWNDGWRKPDFWAENLGPSERKQKFHTLLNEYGHQFEEEILKWAPAPSRDEVESPG